MPEGGSAPSWPLPRLRHGGLRLTIVQTALTQFGPYPKRPPRIEDRLGTPQVYRRNGWHLGKELHVPPTPVIERRNLALPSLTDLHAVVRPGLVDDSRAAFPF